MLKDVYLSMVNEVILRRFDTVHVQRQQLLNF